MATTQTLATAHILKCWNVKRLLWSTRKCIWHCELFFLKKDIFSHTLEPQFTNKIPIMHATENLWNLPSIRSNNNILYLIQLPKISLSVHLSINVWEIWGEAGRQPRSGMSDRKSSLCLDDYFWNRLPVPFDRLGGVSFKVVTGRGAKNTQLHIPQVIKHQ